MMIAFRRLDEVLTALGYNGDNAAHTTEAVSLEESDEFFNLYDTDGSGATGFLDARLPRV